MHRLIVAIAGPVVFYVAILALLLALDPALRLWPRWTGAAAEWALQSCLGAAGLALEIRRRHARYKHSTLVVAEYQQGRPMLDIPRALRDAWRQADGRRNLIYLAIWLLELVAPLGPFAHLARWLQHTAQ